MKKDYEFRMKATGKTYNKAWKACARLYGRSGPMTLSDDGDEAFDPFVAGYMAGLRAGKRRRPRKGGA